MLQLFSAFDLGIHFQQLGIKVACIYHLPEILSFFAAADTSTNPLWMHFHNIQLLTNIQWTMDKKQTFWLPM